MKKLQQLIIILAVICILTSCVTGNVTTTTTTSSTTASTTTNTTPTPPAVGDTDEGPLTDPYVNMTADEFYASYEPATTYRDSYFRSLHYFMSGSIDEQDQAPTVAEDQPSEGDMLIRNTSAVYMDDGNTYCIIDAEGKIVNRIFRGGAYVTLEEVAAYTLAFGDVPANYTTSKRTEPDESPWGKYLRLNNSYFKGDTSRYPYEPELPNISGCGGDLQYYEIDIGTTGTDCDPGRAYGDYNDGERIMRGAARIVYTRYDKNGDSIIDINERYVFYTYNHYNDFQEYLNYEGGWGVMFGNITGGGKLSSKTDYNPTLYVAVVRRDLYVGDAETGTSADGMHIVELAFICLDKKYFANSTACA